ncbi:MAG TPA: HEAT repeat domain-containing protein [Gemmatimonadaceae bacterium]|nr:HEAT repeat domain-containing protein [Gemmatimonadaceae bacterium]
MRSAPDGQVRFTFAARLGVCGDGGDMVAFGRTLHVGSSVETYGSWRTDGRCQPGPVRVALTVRKHEITAIRTRVGTAPRDTICGEAGCEDAHSHQPRAVSGDEHVTDLGVVPAAGAARYLLALAGQLSGSLGGDALLPAVLADSVTITPALLHLARDAGKSESLRKKALFWAGQLGAPTATLSTIYDETPDPALKRQAIFVLSQRDDRDATDKLMRIVRTDTDFRMRKRALFWLAQKDDPRVTKMIADLILR